MLENLDSLFTTTDVKQFVKEFQECEKACEKPEAFLEEAAVWLSVRIYERHYDLDIPHSFLGLAAAASILPLFPEDRQWWPVVQQAWHAACARKRTPWPLPKRSPASNGWQAFQEAVQKQDFEQGCAAALGLAQDESTRDSFRRQSLKLAMRDPSHAGLKFIYLAEGWKLAERFAWKQVGEILFPALHFLVEARHDSSPASPAAGSLTRLLQNSGVVEPEQSEEFEKKLLFSDSTDEALGALANLAGAGVGLESVWEALQLAAVQALANSKLGLWRGPARAFAFASLAREASQEWKPEEKLEALSAAAALTHRVSLESREESQNRDLEELARRLCPTDTINTLRSVVSHSDPIASATAAIAAMGMDDGKKQELCEALAQLAAKNDGPMGQGYDLLVVKAAVDGYRSFQSPRKDKLLSCCAFFLGRLKKSYQLFGAYGVK